MGFTFTNRSEKTCQGKHTPPRKTASGEFFENSHKTRLAKRHQPLKTRLENRSAPTKTASGVLYYGYRYYDPVTGRWPSRDPIEEKGGFNLYDFVVNNGVNRTDALGLQTIPVPPPYELPTTIKPTLLPPFDQNVNIDLGLPWEPQPKSLPPLGPTIPDVDYEKNVRTYNCAGLAFRTYTPMSETDALGKLRKGTKIDCAKGRCWCGQVKCRYFKFTVRTLARNINTGKWTVGPIWPEPDWHVSCGSGKSCPEKYAKGNINHGDPDNFGKGSIIWNHTTGGADYYYKIVSIIKKRMLLRQC